MLDDILARYVQPTQNIKNLINKYRTDLQQAFDSERTDNVKLHIFMIYLWHHYNTARERIVEYKPAGPTPIFWVRVSALVQKFKGAEFDLINKQATFKTEEQREKFLNTLVQDKIIVLYIGLVNVIVGFMKNVTAQLVGTNDYYTRINGTLDLFPINPSTAIQSKVKIGPALTAGSSVPTVNGTSRELRGGDVTDSVQVASKKEMLSMPETVQSDDDDDSEAGSDYSFDSDVLLSEVQS